MVIIVAAMLDFIVGACIGPLTDEQKAKGFYGLSGELFKQNWDSDYRYSEDRYQDFFSVFAIFFPSVTGIQAGANISGDLKVSSLFSFNQLEVTDSDKFCLFRILLTPYLMAQCWLF